MNADSLIPVLEEMAELLELDGANPFKSGAYDKAARALKDFHGDLVDAIQRHALTEIPGIGKGIAEKITELHTTGRIEEMDELKARVPVGLLEMIRIPGFGPKKAVAMHRELDITTLTELKAACEDGRVSALKGFGAKSTEKILAGIEQLAKYAGRFRLDTALLAAEPILEKLRTHPAVKRAALAGSLRRGRETVKDIDFVVATELPTEVMDFFVALPGVTSVMGKGETKASVVLNERMGADLRCVTPEQFPYALAHFTGSKEHNTRLRQIAKDRGWKLNEYGLFPEGSDVSLPATSEAEIHAHLGLAFVTPEMREDMGEVEAAAQNEMPTLIEKQQLRGLLHMHTTYSDGAPRLEDYAVWAEANGIAWMGITDHSQTLTIANGLSEARVLAQHREIDALNAKYAGRGVRLLKGIESDILLDGSLDYPDGCLSKFEFIIASVHAHFNLSEKEQTLRLCRAADNPHTTVLGHLTGRLILAREGYACDQREILRVAGRRGIAVEINANAYRLDLDWRLVRYAVEHGCKVCISPDAHALAGLDDTRYGLAMARKGWCRAEDVLNCLSADEFLRFAAAKRDLAQQH